MPHLAPATTAPSITTLEPIHGTHSAECYKFGDRHYECALREIERLRAEIKDWKGGSKAEAKAGDEARAECKRLRAERDALKAALSASCDEEREQLWEATPGGGCSRAIAAEAELDALQDLLSECRVALMWPGEPAQGFLDRIDAAMASQTTGTPPEAPA